MLIFCGFDNNLNFTMLPIGLTKPHALMKILVHNLFSFVFKKKLC
jgi:hypothetical protein